MATRPGQHAATTDTKPRAESGDAIRRRSHRLRWVVLVAALLVAVLIALAARSAVSVRQDLLRARSALEQGRSQLLAGDVDAAAASFARARDRFAAAERGANGLVLRSLGWLPILGRTPDAVVGIAAAGTQATEAVTLLARTIAALPGGLAGLAPSRGQVPLDRVASLGSALQTADDLTAQALQTIVGAPDSLLVGVGSARAEAENRLRELHDAVHTAARIVSRLPSFLGATTPRHYFFGAESPAELRGTGGLMGAYSILTIDRGRFEFSPFRPIESLRIPDLADVAPPNRDYADNYDPFRGGRRFWTAINLMPDFPSVARALLNAYEAVRNERLDGVITADPFALQTLLEATGPARVPGYGVVISARNVVSFTTNRAYSLFSSPSARKRILGDVATTVFDRFVSAAAPSYRSLRSLERSAAAGHIQIYSSDAQMEDGLRASPIGGALDPGTGDFLAAVVNSAAGSKVDFYQERTVSDSVRLLADGTSRSTVTVELANGAPTTGQPRYVIGPYRPTAADGRVGPLVRNLAPGDSVALLNVYGAPGSVPLGSPELDGAPARATERSDLGVPYVQSYFPIHSGRTATFDTAWGRSEGWQGNDSGGTYHLSFQNQTTIRPTRLHVEITPPPGMSIVSATAGVRVVDGRAVYDGLAPHRLDIQIAFEPPLYLRLWRDALRFFRQPIIRF